MKICIVAEGSYPYVRGGVSSWLQMLIESMPEHEFEVYAIGAYESEKGKFNYELPENLVKVHEVFLDSGQDEEGIFGKRYEISKQNKKAIEGLISGEPFCWNDLFLFVLQNSDFTAIDFLMSKDFYDMVSEVAETKYPHIVFNDFFWTVRAMLLPLLTLIKEGMPKADIYHAVCTGYAGVMAGFGKYTHHRPMILTEHGIYTREREEEIIKADWVKGCFKDNWIEYFYNMSSCAYENADKVISLFKRNMEIQHEMGCSSDKTDVIVNGIEIGRFKDISSDNDEKTINLGAIVRVVPIKDIKTMIQGFAVAKEKVKNIRLYIMGPADEDEEYMKECKQLVKELGVKDVVFTGHVDVKEHIGNMDIMLLSSISEGQPLAVLEGMSASKPHILTDVGCCKELIYGAEDDFGDAGIVVSVMDYEEFGLAIIKLCKNKKLRKDMGNVAYKRVGTFYMKNDFVENYKSLYDKIGRVYEYGRSRV